DGSGSGNHGTANALGYVAGKVGAQAAQFNVTSSYVSIPRSVTDDFTVAMWVKPRTPQARPMRNGGLAKVWWTAKSAVAARTGARPS
ncbi:MAG TPA: hypothetical protein PKA41_14410, partial [Verrucomicrobiota bacterium]|nr:hypothetical protein [Verrucomicrobiota bacterium]